MTGFSRLLVSILPILIGLSTTAQSQSKPGLTVYVGGNVTYLDREPSRNTDNIVGGLLGIEATVPLSETFALGGGLEFYQRGFADVLRITSSTGESLERRTVQHRASYLSVPLNAYLTVPLPRFSPRFFFGSSLGIKVTSNDESTSFGGMESTNPLADRYSDFITTLQVGSDIRLHSLIKLPLSLRIRFSQDVTATYDDLRITSDNQAVDKAIRGRGLDFAITYDLR